MPFSSAEELSPPPNRVKKKGNWNLEMNLSGAQRQALVCSTLFSKCISGACLAHSFSPHPKTPGHWEEFTAHEALFTGHQHRGAHIEDKTVKAFIIILWLSLYKKAANKYHNSLENSWKFDLFFACFWHQPCSSTHFPFFHPQNSTRSQQHMYLHSDTR